MAGRLAQRDLPSGDLGKLRELADLSGQHAASGVVSQTLAADRVFHLGLVGLTGNQLIVETVARLRDQKRLHNLRMIAKNGQLCDSAAVHAQTLDVISRHDQAGAESLVRRHLAHIRKDWLPAPPGALQAD